MSAKPQHAADVIARLRARLCAVSKQEVCCIDCGAELPHHTGRCAIVCEVTGIAERSCACGAPDIAAPAGKCLACGRPDINDLFPAFRCKETP